MKKISRKEFLKKDVYIMYSSKEEYKDILKLIEDNFNSARWYTDGKKPTEFDFNEWSGMSDSGFIDFDDNKLYTTCYLILDSERKLVITYSELKEIVETINKELLTTQEKQYITKLLRASGLKIDYVEKKNPNSSYGDIIRIAHDQTGNTLYLTANCYLTFRKLEENTPYTLDELGIDTKYKINLTEFWNSDKLMAIHCDTGEKAYKLLEAFDNLGKRWGNYKSYLDKSEYNEYKERTCYTNDNCYCRYEFCKRNDYTVYEFDEVDLNN